MALHICNNKKLILHAGASLSAAQNLIKQNMNNLRKVYQRYSTYDTLSYVSNAQQELSFQALLELESLPERKTNLPPDDFTLF